MNEAVFFQGTTTLVTLENSIAVSVVRLDESPPCCPNEEVFELAVFPHQSGDVDYSSAMYSRKVQGLSSAQSKQKSVIEVLKECQTPREGFRHLHALDPKVDGDVAQDAIDNLRLQ